MNSFLFGALLIAVFSPLDYATWWRVAQREHYQPGRILTITALWYRVRPLSFILLALAVAFAIAALVRDQVVFGILAMAALGASPIGLQALRRKTLPVVTSRLKRLVAITLGLHVAFATLLLLSAGIYIVLLPFLTIFITELALLTALPVEELLGRKYLRSAAATIKNVSPRVVAITGSYGKTSTKNYTAHLLSGRWSTLASPASFNNVLGLSRAVNDRLVPGTDVFVAEMGTYGPGEIAALCRIFPPEVSAITTIGEAHLERMKDRDTIVRAKSEILEQPSVVVLNVDVPELAAAADRLDATKRVIRCSAENAAGADVVVRREDGRWLVELAGTEHSVTLPLEVGHPINVAIAVGLALALDVPEKSILDRLASLPNTPHRAETTRTPDGLTVIDDTYNANPEGAAQALASARALVADGGTVWTITPGMVELGSEQAARNADLAKAATASEALQLCVVGHTNRAALRSGEPSRTQLFPSREAAKARVLAAARAGDVLLYENDLPDHYP